MVILLNGEPPGARIRTSVNRQKVIDNKDEEKDNEIIDQYKHYFEAFKHFIDDLIHDDNEDTTKPPTVQAKGVKRKNAIKSNNKRKEEQQADAYEQSSQQQMAGSNINQTDENQAKLQSEAQEHEVSRFMADTNKDAPFGLANGQTPDGTGAIPDQNQTQNINSQNNQQMLMSMIVNHMTGQQQTQQQNTQQNMQQNFAQMSQGFMQQSQMGMMNPSSLAMNSQSLLLLQRIIQTTPEIQMLHQQEQLALYQIQQSIKAALSQSLGQEVISHLVMEYQKTQEQHQISIQAAIQKKLTLILCQNNPQLLFGQQNQMPQQPEAQPEPSIEPNIEKYRRSSYHLGISYYILSKYKKEYTQQQQQQQHQQMLLSSMMQAQGQTHTQQKPEGGGDINSKVDDIMKS